MAQKGGMMNILRNRATLYSVFFLSVVYLLFLLLQYDFPSVFFFGLVGLVTSFFTRNMLIVLSISLLVTVALKMGGVLATPVIPPISETTTTTEMVIFDEDEKNNLVDTVSRIHEIDVKKEVDIEVVTENESTANELLMVPGYQTSIMLFNDSPVLEFEKPIELIPVDMENTYGYEFNNPFSKLGQKCGVSEHYSCFK
jgi:hypothetical protein